MKTIPICQICKHQHKNRYSDPCTACHLIPLITKQKTYWVPNNYEEKEEIKTMEELTICPSQK